MNINERFRGRAEILFSYLLNKYELAYNGPSADIRDLLVALGQRLPLAERELCNKFASAITSSPASAYAVTKEDRELGQAEARYILERFPDDYASRLLSKDDFIPEMNEYYDIQRTKQRIRRYGVLGAIAAVVLFIIGYNLPYFAEGRLYEKVKEDFNDRWPAMYHFDRYLKEYPDGRHIEEVLMLPVQNSYYEPMDAIHAAAEYLKRFPDGKYAQEAAGVYDKIWNKEIAKYEEYSANTTNTQARTFMTQMLKYMRDNHLTRIYVKGVPTLNLKEYDEYPQIVRSWMEDNFNEGTRSVRNPQIPEDVLTIKDKITPAQAKEWTKIIIENVQNGFNRILSTDFVQFEPFNGDDEEFDENPNVTINFNIKTQELDVDGYKVPDLWIYQETTQSSNIVNSSAIVLGMEMTFDAQFRIPGVKTPLDISGAGNPGSNGIQADKSKVYRIMCQRCAVQFADDVEAQLGVGKNK